jgi:hypothetical protein
MFPVELPGYRKDRYKDYTSLLLEACSWRGITRGRAQDYVRLLTEFHEQQKQTRQHILAYNEACEVIDIYRFWLSKVDRFPGLRTKIFNVLRSGPVLMEEERAQKSNNRARNDSFGYYLAGMLLAADVPVIAVDGVLEQSRSGIQSADITLLWGTDLVDIECKRPQRWQSLDARVKEAGKQIEARNRTGVIAVDCSVMVRPPGGMLRSRSIADANSFIVQSLTAKCYRPLAKLRSKSLLGFLLFARIPVITKIAKSSVITSEGQPLTYIQRESLTTYISFNNNDSDKPGLLPSIVRQFKTLVDSGLQ